jgi:DNA-binding MarR family transcriptional regulator
MNLRSSAKSRAGAESSAQSQQEIRDMAHFRYALRKFLRFSENAARRSGVTPQQHQLMLGVAGYTGRGSATVSELAEFLQEQPHSVVGLVERAVQHGLVRREQDETDRRVVNVSLTENGREILSGLTKLHQEEASAFKQVPGLAFQELRYLPQSEGIDRRRRRLDLTTKPEVLREYKGKMRTK